MCLVSFQYLVCNVTVDVFSGVLWFLFFTNIRDARVDCLGCIYSDSVNDCCEVLKKFVREVGEIFSSLESL